MEIPETGTRNTREPLHVVSSLPSWPHDGLLGSQHHLRLCPHVLLHVSTLHSGPSHYSTRLAICLRVFWLLHCNARTIIGARVWFVLFTAISPKPRTVLAHGGLPRRMCRINKELNEAGKRAYFKRLQVSSMVSTQKWGRGEAGEARNRQVLSDKVTKDIELLAKGWAIFWRQWGVNEVP